LVSEKDWQALQETLYFNSVPGLVDSILMSEKEDLSDLERFDSHEEW